VPAGLLSGRSRFDSWRGHHHKKPGNQRFLAAMANSAATCLLAHERTKRPVQGRAEILVEFMLRSRG